MYIFRVDGNQIIGAGHVMRCFTLALWLQKYHGGQSLFICQQADIEFCTSIMQHMFPVITVDTIDAPIHHHISDSTNTALIIDHYALNEHWVQAHVNAVKKIVLIDDMANKNCICDIVINMNGGYDVANYQGLLPPNTLSYIGLDYMLLRPALYETSVFRKYYHMHHSAQEVLLLNFSTGDDKGMTLQILTSLQQVSPPNIDVIVIYDGPDYADCAAICIAQGYDLYQFTPDIHFLLAKATIAIGAGGVNMWERAFLHIPSIVISIADNQYKAAHYAHSQHMAYYMGHYNDIDTQQLDIIQAMQQAKQFFTPEHASIIGDKHQQMIEAIYQCI